MKRLKKALVSVVLISTFGTASAIPVPDFVDPAPDVTITTISPYTYIHDITDGVNGYVAGVDTITSAMLSIHLIDSATQGQETLNFVIGSGGTSQTYTDLSNNAVNNGANGALFGITLVAALTDLQNDGKLTVVLNALSGSYEFADSTLTAEVTRGTTQQGVSTLAVPEPASLALLGIGLLGLGAARRRKH